MKLELRKPRAGLVTRRNGYAAFAALVIEQLGGKAPHVGRIADPEIALPTGHILPVWRKAEALVGPGKAIGETGDRIRAFAINETGDFDLFQAGIAGAAEGVGDDVSIGGPKAVIVQSEAERQSVDDLMI